MCLVMNEQIWWSKLNNNIRLCNNLSNISARLQLNCISIQNNLIDRCWWLTYACTYKHSQVKTTTKQGSTAADGVLTIQVSFLCWKRSPLVNESHSSCAPSSTISPTLPAIVPANYRSPFHPISQGNHGGPTVPRYWYLRVKIWFRTFCRLDWRDLCKARMLVLLGCLLRCSYSSWAFFFTFSWRFSSRSSI